MIILYYKIYSKFSMPSVSIFDRMVVSKLIHKVRLCTMKEFVIPHLIRDPEELIRGIK